MASDIKSASPDRATLVLGTLILVAAVANLNLSVANVALPDIGRAFDASQTQLNLIAVGYSLGLAGTVLYLGGLGRPIRPQDVAGHRHGAVHSGVDRGGIRRELRSAVPRSDSRRRLGRSGVPDHAGNHHGVVGRTGTNQGDCHVVGNRWRDFSTRSDRLGGAARAVSLGFGLLRHPSLGPCGTDLFPGVGSPLTSTRRPSESITSAA